MKRRLRTLVAVFSLTLSVALSAQTRPGPESRQIDPAALAVLQAMDDAFAGAAGLVATYRSEAFLPDGRPAGVETVKLKLGRPNVYEVRTRFGTSTTERILASNGTKRFNVTPGGTAPITLASGVVRPPAPTRCMVSDVAPLNDAREIDTFNPIYWSFYDLGEWQIRSAMLGHWSTKWRLADPGLRTVRYIGRETLDGVPVDVIEWTYTINYSRPADDPVYTSRLSVGLDHFIRRIETTSTSKNANEGRRIVETIGEIRATPIMPKSDFAYEPPEGAVCQPYDQEASYVTGKFVDLPIGSKAPDFTLKTARGETLRFSEFLEQHKVVLMNYWGYG
jgi:hypothetical protein